MSLSSVSLSVVFKFFSVSSLYSEDLRRRPNALGVDDLVQGLMEVSLCKTSCCLRVSKRFSVKELELKMDCSVASWLAMGLDAILDFGC